MPNYVLLNFDPILCNWLLLKCVNQAILVQSVFHCAKVKNCRYFQIDHVENRLVYGYFYKDSLFETVLEYSRPR